MTDKSPSAAEKSDEKSDEKDNGEKDKDKQGIALKESSSNENEKIEKGSKKKDDEISLTKRASKANLDKDKEPDENNNIGSKLDVSRGFKLPTQFSKMPKTGNESTSKSTSNISKRSSSHNYLKNSDSDEKLTNKKSPQPKPKVPAIVLPEVESAAEVKKKEIVKKHLVKPEQAKKEKNKLAKLSCEKDDTKDETKEKVVRIKENEKLKDNEKGKETERERTENFHMKFKFETPEDETDLSLLQLESSVVSALKLMEEYRFALCQVHLLITELMRKGNGTTDLENIKSEKNMSKPEKLYKDAINAAVFWNNCPELQPMLFNSLKNGCSELGAAERYLQEHGPKHMTKLRKFLYKYYPLYAEMKKETHKLVQKAKPELQSQIDDYVKKMSAFVKQRYTDMKYIYLAEIQCAIEELEHYNRQAEKIWVCIAEKKNCKRFKPEPFDFSQFNTK